MYIQYTHAKINISNQIYPRLYISYIKINGNKFYNYLLKIVKEAYKELTYKPPSPILIILPFSNLTYFKVIETLFLIIVLFFK